jgi:hypothetical protein
MSVAKLCRFVPLLSLAAVIACGDHDSAKVDAGGDGGDAGVEGDADTSDAEADAELPDGAVPSECPEISFVSPTGADLNEADDKDKDRCKNGFQYDVTVATSAPDGTPASLFADATSLGEATVAGAAIKFSNVQLTANAESLLRVQVGGVRCIASLRVEVGCSVPRCEVTKPVLSPSHPKLNGVPVANGGDRVSNPGSPYQVEMEVETSVEDGQPVQLAVDGSEVLLTAMARAGKARFPGVTLAPDGDHQVVATCISKTGSVGTSARASYGVDSAGPELTIVSPAEGTHYEQVTGFDVCATSTSADARDLPAAAAPTGGQNLCGAIGGASPACAAVTTQTQGGTTLGRGCVTIGCPGGPAFDVTLTLRDAAGNSTSKVLSGITCQTNLPSIDIVSPSSTVAGDPSTRILAASAAQARKDAQANVAGAQFTVVACTEVNNASVQLQAGLAGSELANVGPAQTAVAAVPADGCPSGKPYVAKFVNATLPESAEASAGTLTTATRLVAVVTDASTAKGSSPAVDVWVDSQAPTLTAALPVPLCGRFYQNATSMMQELRVTTSVLPVTVTVTAPDSSQQALTATSYSSGLLASLGVATFASGVSTVSSSVAEPSGNTAALPTPCEVTVGNPPIVTWTTPTATSKLSAANDADPSTPGWQGALTVHTDVGAIAPAPTVQFSTNSGGNLGAPVAVDGSGNATLSGVTIPEGAAVQLIATTSDVAARGVGRASITVPVDTGVPSPATGLVATVPEDKRRQTTFRLAWTAPADNGQPVAGYDVRVSTTAITDATTFAAAEQVSYTGTPAQPGQPDSIEIPDRYIERNYYFAVAPLDVGGNAGAIASAGPARASFKTTVLVGAGGNTEGFGRSVDGSQSLNGDAFADLIVGAATGSAAYIYFGSATGYPSTASVVISGPGSVQFGFTAALIGDIDADGLTDLAISAPTEGGGTVYIFKGRASWPATLTASNADYLVAPAVGNAAFSAAFMGGAMVRLNDFDGDGADDFAIGGRAYAGNSGYVAVVRGVPAGQTFPSLVTLGAASARTLETASPSPDDVFFGIQLTNLGAFYGGSKSVLAATASAYGGGGNRWGAAFAFYNGTLNAASPADSFIANSCTWQPGISGNCYFEAFLGHSIAPLGALGSPMAVAVGVPAYTGQARTGVTIHLGTVSTGPFVPTPIFLKSPDFNKSGDCVFGSVIPGVATSQADHKSSFLGSALPDLAMSASRENTGLGVPKLYFIDGQKVPSLVSGDLATTADVQVDLPSTWTGGLTCLPRSGAIRDLNNDGFADMAVAQYNRLGGYKGEVLVLW